MQNPDVDVARLAAKTAGATVVNLDDYRTNSESAGKTSGGSPYISPATWTVFFYVVLALAALAFIKR